MKLINRQAFFIVALLVLIIGVLEITLFVLAFVSPRVDRLLTSPWTSTAIAPIVSDARLGHRPNPDYPGHDREGFRNLDVPGKANIVALGDSQTYGTGVESKDTWPRQLESMTGKIVYSMAYGGYGPTHSLVLWDKAIAFSPTIIIEAFYAGNDLFDSFDHVYNQGQLIALKSSDPQLQASVRKAEESEPIAKRASQMFRMGAITTTSDNFSPRKFLSQYSKIYGLLRRVRYESKRLFNKPNNTAHNAWEMAMAFAKVHPEFCQVFRDKQFKTVFTS